MPMYQKFLWGLVAGIVVLCVKILGPDIEHINKLFSSSDVGGKIAAYCFLSLVTIILGGLSALFTNDVDPRKVLVFCASFPAMVATWTATPVASNNTDLVPSVVDEVASSHQINFSIINKAHAQNEENEKFVCKEASFTKQFTTEALSYITRTREEGDFAVVVASKKDFDEAVAEANRIASITDEVETWVGCKKPGNQYFPVIIGEITSQTDAAKLLGIAIGKNFAPEDAYLSRYQYREKIYPEASN